MTDRTPLAFHQQGEGWHLEPRRHRVLRFGVGAVGVLGLLAGVGNLTDGDTAAGVGLLLFGLLMLAAAFLLHRRPRPRPPRHLAAAPGPGLLVPVRAGSLLAVVGFGVLGAFFLLVVTAAGVLMLRDGELPGIAALVAGPVLGALFLAGAWGTVTARRTPDRGILLTPDAVVLRTRAEPETIPWSELVRVRDHWGRGVRVGPTMPDDIVNNWLTFETREPDGDRLSLLSGSPDPSVPVETLGTDPALALAVCRHYLEHPGERAGLADPQVLARWI